MELVSVRNSPEYASRAVAYFQRRWASNKSQMVYQDCISSSLSSPSPLPQWYLLLDSGSIAGGAGLITNDFISRMDLYPWLCALYVEEEHRGNSLGALLLERGKADAKAAGFSSLYLCTDLEGYYEKYGFDYLAQGYHPWGESSRIYRARL